MNFWWIAVVIVAVVGAAMQTRFIYLEYIKEHVLADVFKGLASLMFVTIGFIGYRSVSSDSMGLMILLGLIFGLIGDVVLNLRFILKDDAGQKAFLIGIVAFLIGHVMYVCALLPLSTHRVTCIIVGVIVAMGLIAYIFNTMDVKTSFKIFGIVYLTVIFIMTTLAVEIAIFAPVTKNLIFAVGAVFFMASDIILIFNTFSGKNMFTMRVTNLSLYYVGQLLIAASLMIG